MKSQYKRRATDKIRFSIGSKLILIITIIVLLSLGSITVLVSWLVREDVQITAEDNNREVNRRSEKEAEYTFTKTRSESAILLQALSAVGTESALAKETADYFFAQNPQVAALIFTTREGRRGVQSRQETTNLQQSAGLLVNERFFREREIDPALAEPWRASREEALDRAEAGENVLLNEGPHFAYSLLSLFFPWQKGGGGVLFFPDNLNESFGSGVNQSCLINGSGDLLIHTDIDLVRSGTNVANWDFIGEIRKNSEQSNQIKMNADFSFGRSAVVPADSPVMAGARPGEQGFFQQKWESVKLITRRLIRGVARRVPVIAKVLRQQEDGTENGAVCYIAFSKLGIGDCIVITSIERDTVLEGIDATTRRNIYLTITVLSISILFIWFFSKSISRPLKTLAFAARQIEGGVFEVELHHRGRDEIGALTNSFKKMCTALGIFGRFTNKEIAIKAMRGQIKPGGFPKHATVFFSDIRNFTAKSEAFTNEFGEEASNRIVQWLNGYFTQMINCIEKTNGVVDKFIGDAVMAHWGTAYTTGSPKKDAFNCVKAALMMRLELIRMNKNRARNDPGDPPIQIGCGINTGIVTAGQIGSDMRMEYTVIGDPVNLASRTEALNKPLGTDILITEDTWNLVKDYFITEEMPSVTVKGKEKPVRIFAVVNFAGIGKGPQNLSSVRRILGIQAPDMSKVDLNEDERKYKIGGKG